MTDPLWDPLGKAREALRSIVADFGPSALSRPPVLENVLRDLLPGSQRQVSLIVAAAGAGVTSTLEEHVAQGIDPSTAVRLASAQLAEQTPFDAAGCRWVTGEFALALGYQLAGGREPDTLDPSTIHPVAAPTIEPGALAGRPGPTVESGSQEDNQSTSGATDLPTQTVPVIVGRSRLDRPASRRRAPATWIVVLIVVLVASAGGITVALIHHGDGRTTTTTSTTATSSTTTTSSTALVIATLPLVKCPTTYGVPMPAAAPLPSTMTLDVPDGFANRIAFYSDERGAMKLIGPKGWQCSATYGADGSGAVRAFPVGEQAPMGSAFTPQAQQAIVGSETSACVGCSEMQACPLFSAAAADYLNGYQMSCPETKPAEESTVQISPGVIGFEDLAGTAGDGNPSGGPYPANGVMTYYSGNQGGSWLDTCTLPESDHALCTVVLNSFINFYGNN